MDKELKESAKLMVIHIKNKIYSILLTYDDITVKEFKELPKIKELRDRWNQIEKLIDTL